MDIHNMTKKQLERLPCRKWDAVVTCDSLIILPARVHWQSLVKYKVRQFLAQCFGLREPDIWEVNHLHDSGYRCLGFVAVVGDKPLCRLSGCSDVIHFGGIGGYGYNWLEQYGSVPKAVPPGGWAIDCLPKSGLLRIFCKGKIMCGPALSSFEIYIVENERKGGD